MACGAKNPPKLPKIAETETILAVSYIPKPLRFCHGSGSAPCDIHRFRRSKTSRSPTTKKDQNHETKHPQPLRPSSGSRQGPRLVRGWILGQVVHLASAVATVVRCPGSGDFTTTFTDNLDTVHNYSGGNVAGTIWNGVVNAGNAVTLNSSTATAGQLRIAAANAVGWDAGFNNAPFLYKSVAGDFDARVQVTAMTTGNYNVSALMARLGNSSADGTAGEDFMQVASNQFNPFWIQGRSVDDTTKLDSSGPSGLAFPRWLRLTRTSNTFNIYYGTDGTNWTGINWGGVVGANIGLDLMRNDLNGLPLQVGLWQGSFSSSGQTADFDNFSLTMIPEPSAGLLALGAGGVVRPSGRAALSRKQ